MFNEQDVNSKSGKGQSDHSNRYLLALQRFQQLAIQYERECNLLSRPDPHDAVFREYMKRIGRK